MVVRTPAVTALAAASLALTAIAPRPPFATITLTPGTTYQVMRGWEVATPGWRLTTDAFLQQVVDRGINRVRLEIGAGAENSVDYLGNYYANDPSCAPYPAAGWQCDPGPPNGQSASGDALNAHRYEVINDDSDPNTITASGFHFSGLDAAITRTVNPMRTKLGARGETLWVNLCYVAFVGAGTAHPMASAVHQDPAEYAEFILATFQHIDTTFGWTPNSVEIILEPDNSQNFWGSVPGSPTLVGQMVKAAGDRLAAAGYHPDFVMPSTTSYASVSSYLNGAQTVTGAMAYVAELGFHAYNQTGGTASVAADSADAGVCSSMLEWWDASNTYSFLHDLLANGNMCAYQRGVVQPLSEEDYYPYLQQYFKYVRMGATRIEASSNDGSCLPLAWINTNGTYAVVTKTTGSCSLSIAGLPAGTYSVRYTTASNTDVNPGDIVLSSGSLSTSIPAAGVIVVAQQAAAGTTIRLPFRCCEDR